MEHRRGINHDDEEKGGQKKLEKKVALDNVGNGSFVHLLTQVKSRCFETMSYSGRVTLQSHIYTYTHLITPLLQKRWSFSAFCSLLA